MGGVRRHDDCEQQFRRTSNELAVKKVLSIRTPVIIHVEYRSGARIGLSFN